MPASLVSVYYYLKYRAKISTKAEVDLSNNLQFGGDCVVGSFAKIKADKGLLKIGERARIAVGCFITSREGQTVIGDNFIAGPNVNIICGNYRYDRKGVHLEDLGNVSKGIVIGDHVWLGAGCTVVDGAQIGDNTIVVANSLVNRKYPSDVILQGNPAKVIARR